MAIAKGLRSLGVAIALGAVAMACAESPTPKAAPEHAVVVHFSYGSTDLSRLFALEDKLEAAIAEAQAGEFDGDEIAVDGSDGFLYMYGPDGDRLFQVVEPVLRTAPFMNGAKVKIRYGPPEDGVAEKEITIAL
jgi:hypothetical protein